MWLKIQIMNTLKSYLNKFNIWKFGIKQPSQQLSGDILKNAQWVIQGTLDYTYWLILEP